ncbi:hypothetical protein D3C76_1088330 [compost metagenome]
MRLPGHAVGVAQARGKQTLLAVGRIDFPDGGATCFLIHAVLTDIAVGANRNVELFAIAAGDDILGPVMVQRAAGQFGHQRARRSNFSSPGLVTKAHEPIGVGYIEIVADQGHAKRRIEVFNKGGTDFGHAVMVTVAQQADAVGAGHAGTGATHHLAHHPATNALAVLGLGRGVGFRDQHIAIGQDIQPARVIQALGEGGHLGARCSHRLGAWWPANGRGDVDGGDQGLVRLGQLRRWPESVTDLQPGSLAAAADSRGNYQQHGDTGHIHGVALAKLASVESRGAQHPRGSVVQACLSSSATPG